MKSFRQYFKGNDQYRQQLTKSLDISNDINHSISGNKNQNPDARSSSLNKSKINFNYRQQSMTPTLQSEPNKSVNLVTNNYYINTLKVQPKIRSNSMCSNRPPSAQGLNGPAGNNSKTQSKTGISATIDVQTLSREDSMDKKKPKNQMNTASQLNSRANSLHTAYNNYLYNTISNDQDLSQPSQINSKSRPNSRAGGHNQSNSFHQQPINPHTGYGSLDQNQRLKSVYEAVRSNGLSASRNNSRNQNHNQHQNYETANTILYTNSTKLNTDGRRDQSITPSISTSVTPNQLLMMGNITPLDIGIKNTENNSNNNYHNNQNLNVKQGQFSANGNIRGGNSTSSVNNSNTAGHNQNYAPANGGSKFGFLQNQNQKIIQQTVERQKQMTNIDQEGGNSLGGGSNLAPSRNVLIQPNSNLMNDYLNDDPIDKLLETIQTRDNTQSMIKKKKPENSNNNNHETISYSKNYYQNPGGSYSSQDNYSSSIDYDAPQTSMKPKPTIQQEQTTISKKSNSPFQSAQPHNYYNNMKIINNLQQRGNSLDMSGLRNDRNNSVNYSMHLKSLNDEPDDGLRISGSNQLRGKEMRSMSLPQELTPNKIQTPNNNANPAARQPTPNNQPQEEENSFDFQYSFRTKQGVLASNPNQTNQDAYLICTNFKGKPWMHFFSVCDGHGVLGHHVSDFVKQHLPAFLALDSNLLTNPKLALFNAAGMTNHKLALSEIDCMFSGTTMVSFLIQKKKLYSSNSGDSRAIIGRRQNNQDWQPRPLTRDHKPDVPKQAERIVRCGGRIDSFRDAEGNPLGPARVWLQNENIPGLAMSRSIGDGLATSVGVTWEPEIFEFDLDTNDKFIVIASDGVWEFIENEQCISMISPFYEQDDLEGACDILLKQSYARWTVQDDTVVDDITFVIIFFEHDQ